jgi:DNA-binding PadR family transcriptional regulator
MRGTSTHLRGALLGLLLERPGHGGDLAARLVARLGPTWRIDTNDVYRLLDKLVEEGLACACEEKPAKHRRTRVVFSSTEDTPKAVALWMETLLPREPVRLGLQAKLSVAREQDRLRLLSALKEYERECFQLAELVSATTGEPGSWQGLFIDCARDAVFAQLQADVDWAIRTRRRIGSYEGGIRR